MSSEIPVRRRSGAIPWWLLALLVAIAIVAALYLFGVLGTPAGTGAGGVQVTAAPTEPAPSG